MPITRTTSRIPQSEWEGRKPRVIELYLDLGFRLSGPNGIIETMANEGFVATKSQYEYQFQRWKVRKNMKRHEYETIIQKRRHGREPTPITLGGRVISDARSKRALRRYTDGMSPAAGPASHSIDGVAQGNMALLIPTRGRPTPVVASEVAIPMAESDNNRASTTAMNLSIGSADFDPGELVPEQEYETIDMPFNDQNGASGYHLDIDDPLNPINFNLQGPSSNGYPYSQFITSNWIPGQATEVDAVPYHQMLSPRQTGARFDVSVGTIQNSPYFTANSSPGPANASHSYGQFLQRAQWTPPSAAIMATLIKDICNAPRTTSTRDVMSSFCDLASDFLGGAGEPPNNFPLVLRSLLSTETFFGEDCIKPPSKVTGNVATEARLHSRLVRSIINGFGDLKNIPAANVLSFLNKHHTTSLSMISLLSSNSNPATQSLVENTFRAALEQDNVSIVNFLLNHNKSIHANDTVCHYRGRRCTPLEVAAINRSYAVIQFLISQNVDVNKSFSGSDDCHALSLLLARLDPKSTISDRLFNLVDRFLLAGANISLYYINHQILQFVDQRLVIRLIDKYTSQAPEKLVSDEDFIRYIVQRCTKPDAERVLKLVIERYQRVSADSILGKYLVAYGSDEAVNATDTLINAFRSGDQGDLLTLKEREKLKHLDRRELGEAFTTALREGNLQFATQIVDFDPDLYFTQDRNFQMDAAICAALAHDFDDIAWELTALSVAAGRNPPLCIAVKEKKPDFVKGFIEFGFRLNSTRRNESSDHDFSQEYIMRSSLKLKDYSTLQDLWLHDRFDDEHRILEAAVQWGDNSIIRDLWQARSGAVYPSPRLMNLIIEKGQMELFWDIFEAWGIRDTRDNWPNAINIAIERQDLQLLDELISRGAPLDDDRPLKTALSRHFSMVKPLLQRYKRAYPEGRAGYGRECIEVAVIEYPRSSEWIDVFFEFNLVSGDIFCGGKDGVTLLGRAMFGGNIWGNGEHPKKNLIERLLDTGSDANVTMAEVGSGSHHSKTTGFLLAIQTENEEIVRLLIQRGADVNKPARFGIKRTPLQMAAELNHIEIANLLLENGAEVNAPPALFSGATALQFAAIHGNYNLAVKLLEHGARLDVPPSKGPQGRWPLEGAAENGRLDMIQLLWDANNGPFHDKQCQKAMRLAEYYGYLGCRDLIKELMAKS